MMATLTTKIEVDVTSSLHTALIDFAESYYEEYGVKLYDITFDWTDDCASVYIVSGKD
jgi:hypothetical protein